MDKVKENEVTNVNTIPAHARGMLIVDEIEISPVQLFKEDKEKFLTLYKRYCWKLNGVHTKMDIFINLLELMEEAASDEVLTDPNVYKAFARRPRNAFALAKANFHLCCPEDRAALLKEFQSMADQT